MKLEILPNIFFDDLLEWFQQPQELIDLALEIEKTTPVGYEYETLGDHSRIAWAEWESSTECGTFRMRTHRIYMFPIEHDDYNIPRSNVIVTIIKLS